MQTRSELTRVASVGAVVSEEPSDDWATRCFEMRRLIDEVAILAGVVTLRGAGSQHGQTTSREIFNCSGSLILAQ